MAGFKELAVSLTKISLQHRHSSTRDGYYAEKRKSKQLIASSYSCCIAWPLCQRNALETQPVTNGNALETQPVTFVRILDTRPGAPYSKSLRNSWETLMCPLCVVSRHYFWIYTLWGRGMECARNSWETHTLGGVCPLCVLPAPRPSTDLGSIENTSQNHHKLKGNTTCPLCVFKSVYCKFNVRMKGDAHLVLSKQDIALRFQNVVHGVLHSTYRSRRGAKSTKGCQEEDYNYATGVEERRRSKREYRICYDRGYGAWRSYYEGKMGQRAAKLWPCDVQSH